MRGECAVVVFRRAGFIRGGRAVALCAVDAIHGGIRGFGQADGFQLVSFDQIHVLVFLDGDGRVCAAEVVSSPADRSGQAFRGDFFGRDLIVFCRFVYFWRVVASRQFGAGAVIDQRLFVFVRVIEIFVVLQSIGRMIFIQRENDISVRIFGFVV